MIEIRQTIPNDLNEIWNIIKAVITTGDTYVFDPNSSKEKMLDYWYAKDKHTYTALLDEKIAGTFLIKDNQPDLGSHVANAAYMVSTNFAGKGIGKAMGEFSLKEAQRLGYRAMQFNIVVKSNEKAITLWCKLGFEIIGEIPAAFKHATNGFTNAYIMYRQL